MNLSADPCQQVTHVLMDGCVFPVLCTVKSQTQVCVCVCACLLEVGFLVQEAVYLNGASHKPLSSHTHTHMDTHKFDFRFMSQSCKNPIQFRFVQI